MPYPILSGQKTVAAAGTAEALGTVQVDYALLVRALDTNTGIVAVGNNGADNVSLATGYRLAAGEICAFEHVDNLAAIFVNAEVNGEGVCWLKLDA